MKTPEKNQSSSSDRTMTDFIDGNGNPIPADHFEDDGTRGPGEQVLPDGYAKNLADQLRGQKKSEA